MFVIEQEMPEADDLLRSHRLPQEALRDGCARLKEVDREIRTGETAELVQQEIDLPLLF